MIGQCGGSKFGLLPNQTDAPSPRSLAAAPRDKPHVALRLAPVRPRINLAGPCLYLFAHNASLCGRQPAARLIAHDDRLRSAFATSCRFAARLHPAL